MVTGILLSAGVRVVIGCAISVACMAWIYALSFDNKLGNKISERNMACR